MSDERECVRCGSRLRSGEGLRMRWIDAPEALGSSAVRYCLSCFSASYRTQASTVVTLSTATLRAWAEEDRRRP